MACSRRWILPSTFEAIEPVCAKVQTVLREHGFGKDAFGIDLLLREAFCNAVKHGNRLNPDKTVDCFIKLVDTTIEIDVSDEGEGFDRECGDRLSEGDEITVSGRGLIIYQMYADEVCFNEKGNRVVLRKKLTAHDVPKPPVAAVPADEAPMRGIVISLPGNLVSDTIEHMRPVFDDAINRSLPDTLLTIDLGAADIVDVRGLGLIMSVCTGLGDKKACLRLVNVSNDVRALLQAVNFHRCIEIV